MNLLKKNFVLILVALISACSNYGSVQLPPDRISYNDSLQYSDTQQILLNIVRLRYTDIPYFLTVNNVVSQFSYSRAGTLNLANNASTPPALLATANGAISLSESPTITYTPLQGEDYAKRLMTPIDLSVSYRLIRSGWSVDKISRLLIQKLGMYDNASIASRQTSGQLPKYKAFQSIGLMLRDLEYSGHLVALPVEQHGGFAIQVTIVNFKTIAKKYLLLLNSMGISQKKPSFWIDSIPTKQPKYYTTAIAGSVQNQVVGLPVQEDHHYYAETRSVLELLNYLSKGVDVPQEHFKRGIARITYDAKHVPFDWRKVTHGQIRVRSSRNKPADNYIAIRYRGYWFYIDDNDIHSKETLNIVSVIMGIYQGNVKSVLPVFTVS